MSGLFGSGNRNQLSNPPAGRELSPKDSTAVRLHLVAGCIFLKRPAEGHLLVDTNYPRRGNFHSQDAVSQTVKAEVTALAAHRREVPDGTGQSSG
ncbi:MAG: hypothetical protein ACI80F_002576 [Natronomonas sp.]|jgi:hypothetical protein